MEEAIQVREVSPAHVAEQLARGGVVDPRGHNSVEAIAAHGQCFEFVTPGGSCAFVVRISDRTWWIDGAASSGGSGMAAIGLAMAEHAAREADCDAVAFETARPGLVRVAMHMGYLVTEKVIGKAAPGWVLKKAVNK